MKDAVESSAEHLRPWMDWVPDEPEPVRDVAQRLRRFRASFDRGKDFVFGIFDRDERDVVGGTGLHPRVGPDALEIGYWIRATQTRHGFATESTAALTRVAFEVCGVDRVEIRVAPANVASLAIPRRLGFEEEATLRRRIAYKEDAVVFSMFAESYASSPAARAAVEAYDSAGARVL